MLDFGGELWKLSLKKHTHTHFSGLLWEAHLDKLKHVCPIPVALNNTHVQETKTFNLWAQSFPRIPDSGQSNSMDSSVHFKINLCNRALHLLSTHSIRAPAPQASCPPRGPHRDKQHRHAPCCSPWNWAAAYPLALLSKQTENTATHCHFSHAHPVRATVSWQGLSQ